MARSNMTKLQTERSPLLPFPYTPPASPSNEPVGLGNLSYTPHYGQLFRAVVHAKEAPSPLRFLVASDEIDSRASSGAKYTTRHSSTTRTHCVNVDSIPENVSSVSGPFKANIQTASRSKARVMPLGKPQLKARAGFISRPTSPEATSSLLGNNASVSAAFAHPRRAPAPLDNQRHRDCPSTLSTSSRTMSTTRSQQYAAQEQRSSSIYSDMGDQVYQRNSWMLPLEHFRPIALGEVALTRTETALPPSLSSWDSDTESACSVRGRRRKTRRHRDKHRHGHEQTPSSSSGSTKPSSLCVVLGKMRLGSKGNHDSDQSLVKPRSSSMPSRVAGMQTVAKDREVRRAPLNKRPGEHVSACKRLRDESEVEVGCFGILGRRQGSAKRVK